MLDAVIVCFRVSWAKYSVISSDYTWIFWVISNVTSLLSKPDNNNPDTGADHLGRYNHDREAKTAEHIGPLVDQN